MKAKKNHDSPNNWERVEEIRADLEDCDDYPIKKEIEKTWNKHIEPHYKNVINRDHKVAGTPLEAMLYYLELGFYPPPEILLAVMECFQLYMNAKGGLSLEEIFYGKPVKGLGNFSQREHTNLLLDAIEFQLKFCTDKGKSDVDIVQEILVKLGLTDTHDVESVLRRLRRRRAAVKKKKTDNQGG